MFVANRSEQGKACKPGKDKTFRAYTAGRKGERHEGRFFIPDIFILQIRVKNGMEDKQKADYSGAVTLGLRVCGLADCVLCPDPLYP